MELFPCRQHVSEMMYVVKKFTRNRFTHIHEYEAFADYDGKENSQPSPKRSNSLIGSGITSKKKRSRRAHRPLHTPKSKAEAPQIELAEVLHLLYEN